MKRALPAFLFFGVNGYCNINFLVVLKLQWAGYKQPTFSHLVLGSRESA